MLVSGLGLQFFVSKHAYEIDLSTRSFIIAYTNIRVHTQIEVPPGHDLEGYLETVLDEPYLPRCVSSVDFVRTCMGESESTPIRIFTCSIQRRRLLKWARSKIRTLKYLRIPVACDKFACCTIQGLGT